MLRGSIGWFHDFIPEQLYEQISPRVGLLPPATFVQNPRRAEVGFNFDF